MPSARIRTQGLTEGAILAALVAIFAVAGRYIPLMSLAATFLCPLPLAVLVIRHGLRVAGIAAIVAVLVGTVLAGPLVGLAILASFAPMGLVIGLGARRGWPASRIVTLGALVASVSITLGFLGLLGGGRLSVDEMARTMERSMVMSTNVARRLGMPPALMPGVGQRLTPIADILRERFDPAREIALLLSYMLPFTFVLGAATTSWLNYEVGRRVLSRFGYHLNPLPPVGTWRLPGAVVWLIPLGVLLALVGELLRVPAVLGFVGGSLQAGGVIAFLLQGLVATWVILGNYDLTKLERGFAFAMALSLSSQIPLINGIFVIVGALDITLRVRDRWGLERPRAGSLGAKP